MFESDKETKAITFSVTVPGKTIDAILKNLGKADMRNDYDFRGRLARALEKRQLEDIVDEPHYAAMDVAEELEKGEE